MQVPANPDQFFLLASLTLAMIVAQSQPFCNPQAPASRVLLAPQRPAFNGIAGALPGSGL